MHNTEEEVPDHRGKGLVNVRPFSGSCSEKRPIFPQVRVELENELQRERQKLGELRKKHYELAGVARAGRKVSLAEDCTAHQGCWEDVMRAFPLQES